MESHHTSKRGAMAAAEDRLSGLPDDLHSILRGLPLKHAARTSALSRWWARQWLRALASSTAIDFTYRDFARHLTSVRIAGEKLRVLELVGCLAVRKLQVAAPALESFAFHGDVVCSSDPDEDDAAAVHFGDTPALRDAYLSHLDSGDYDDDRHDFAYPNFLECIAHANILTLCSVGLLVRTSYPNRLN